MCSPSCEPCESRLLGVCSESDESPTDETIVRSESFEHCVSRSSGAWRLGCATTAVTTIPSGGGDRGCVSRVTPPTSGKWKCCPLVSGVAAPSRAGLEGVELLQEEVFDEESGPPYGGHTPPMTALPLLFELLDALLLRPNRPEIDGLCRIKKK